MSAVLCQHNELEAYLIRTALPTDLCSKAMIVPLGKQPLEFCKKHKLFSLAQQVVAVPHIVCMLDLNLATDEASMKQAEETYCMLASNVLGRPVASSNYFYAWKKKHGATWLGNPINLKPKP